MGYLLQFGAQGTQDRVLQILFYHCEVALYAVGVASLILKLTLKSQRLRKDWNDEMGVFY